MSDMDILRDNLTRLMNAQELSKAQLSHNLNLGNTFVRDLFNDKVRNPSAFNIKKLANFFEITTDELLYDPEEIRTSCSIKAARNPVINHNIMIAVIKDILPLYDKYKDTEAPLTAEEFVNALLLLYNRYVRKAPIEQTEIIQLFKSK